LLHGLNAHTQHGTGKIFTEEADGSVNFDKSTINPLTGKLITRCAQPTAPIVYSV
jgi:hypothetical protein